MSPEASRHRRRIGGLLIANKLPLDYTPENRPMGMELPLCVLCRRPNPNPASSACPTCIPPVEGEIRLTGKVAALEAENATLRQALTRLASFAATAQSCNTREWMDMLVDHLNQTTAILGEPTQFVLHRSVSPRAMWITKRDIP
jgi:hypothetical protein